MDENMRVGFDIGGTFTDVIVVGDDGRLTTTKVLSLLDRVGEDIVGCVHQVDPQARRHHSTDRTDYDQRLSG